MGIPLIAAMTNSGYLDLCVGVFLIVAVGILLGIGAYCLREERRERMVSPETFAELAWTALGLFAISYFGFALAISAIGTTAGWFHA